MAQPSQVATDAVRFRFEQNDRVFCYHGNILYEARCLERVKRSDNNQAMYLLHYVGWNSRWDEWVGDNEILALNCISMKKMASSRAMYYTSRLNVRAKRLITTAKPYSSSGAEKTKEEEDKQNKRNSVQAL